MNAALLALFAITLFILGYRFYSGFLSRRVFALLPDELVPEDAQVEIEAKKAAGYFTKGDVPDEERLQDTKGREFDE